MPLSMKTRSVLAACTIAAIPAVAIAAETITYTYDSKGRLLKVERSGTVNNGVKSEYTLDKADNRVLVKVSGSPNSSP
jgi:hypothetical protein